MTSVPVPVCPLPRAVMFWDGVQNFLESSSIAGFGHIASTRKYARLFWITIVIAGFIGACIMINKSFQQWEENPITTTIESRPIKELTFPKVTVCPPKNTYTDLNYDLRMTENMTIGNDTRHKLANFAMELLWDQLQDDIITNISKLEDHDMFFNWYNGYTEMKLPKYDAYSGLRYEVTTYATSGTIKTKYFGEKFDGD